MDIDVPIKNQRTERTNDGRPPEDGNMDCVACSLAAMCQALLGGFYSGDGLHDQVYGQGYRGLQNPARYVGMLHRLGLRMTSVGGPAPALVGRAIDEIRAGHPVLLSIPSDWNADPPHSRYAHMVAGCDVPDRDTLTAMNPWTAEYMHRSRAWWQERLARCSYRELWVIEKVRPTVAGIPSGWRDDGAALTAPNGHHVVESFRAYVLAAHTWTPDNVPLEEQRQVTSTAWHSPTLGAGTRQVFLRSALRLNNPSVGVREIDLGAELLAVEQQLAAANQQIAQLQQQVMPIATIGGPPPQQTLHVPSAGKDSPPIPYAGPPAPSANEQV
jgi:hypothetical protein